jgi:hypothetical protein
MNYRSLAAVVVLVGVAGLTLRYPLSAIRYLHPF